MTDGHPPSRGRRWIRASLPMTLTLAFISATLAVSTPPASAEPPPDLVVRVSDPAGVPIIGAVVMATSLPVSGCCPTTFGQVTQSDGTTSFDQLLRVGHQYFVGVSQTSRPDLAANPFPDAPAASGIWDGTPLNLDVTMPFLDGDDDGVPDIVECSPDVPGAFCDVDGAGTAGSIVENTTGVTADVIDLPAPSGVRVVAGGTNGQVRVQVCGVATLTIPAGSVVDVTCGSVTITVRSGGPVAIVPEIGGFSVVSVPAGVTARVSEADGAAIVVEHLDGEAPIIVAVDGAEVEVASGADAVTFPTTAPSDTTPPHVTGIADPAPNGAGWHNSPVTVTWVTIDPEPSSGASSIPASSIVDSEGSQVVVESEPSCDPAGNCATGSLLLSIDRTAPTVTIEGVVEGQVFEIGAGPSPSCTTADALSGVATSASAVIGGGNADGSGAFTISCVGAVDVAGNVAPVVAASYEVHYALDAGIFGGGPVEPAPAVNVGKAGRTYPIRWTLADQDGNRITDLSAVTSITHRTAACAGFTGDHSELIEAASTGGGLAITAEGEFKLNWKTPVTKGCRVLTIRLADGNSLIANFELF